MNSYAIKLRQLPKKTADYEIIVIDVGCSDISLKQCVERVTGNFRRGCAFYEFTHEIECISEDKELMFTKVCEVTNITSYTYQYLVKAVHLRRA